MGKKKISFILLIIIMLISALTVALSGCTQPSQTYQPAPRPTYQPTPQLIQNPSSQANLRIIDVRVEKDVQSGYHNLIATVKNDGDGLANDFNAGCEWDCPGGQITHAGADIVQGGYISGNSQFNYNQPFRVQCAGPPSVIYFVCKIDNKDAGKWSGQVKIP